MNPARPRRRIVSYRHRSLPLSPARSGKPSNVAVFEWTSNASDYEAYTPKHVIWQMISPSLSLYANSQFATKIILNIGFDILIVSILSDRAFNVALPSAINDFPPVLISTSPYAPLRSRIIASHSSPAASR